MISPPAARVRLASVEHIDGWMRSLARQQQRNGLPFFFSPRSRHDPRPPLGEADRVILRDRLHRLATEARFLRLWVAEVGGEIVGHATLDGRELPSERHRCTLGLGVDAEHHRRGLGGALLSAAVGWARAEPSIDFVDLGVFAGNEPALALYASAGFVETGRTEARFRVDGVDITDVQMTLRL